MKYYYIIVLLFTFINVNAQTSSSDNVFTTNGNIININTKYIYNDITNVKQLSFTTNEISTLKVGDTQYMIKVGRFKGWENEPGDFDVIQFYDTNKNILTFKNCDCIAKLNDPNNLYTYNFHKYSPNGYFIEQNLSQNKTLIIFLGYHYGTDSPDLIMFVATETDIKLIFCRKMYIRELIKNDNSISINYEGYNENTKGCIYSDNGLLKIIEK